MVALNPIATLLFCLDAAIDVASSEDDSYLDTRLGYGDDLLRIGIAASCFQPILARVFYTVDRYSDLPLRRLCVPKPELFWRRSWSCRLRKGSLV